MAVDVDIYVEDIAGVIADGYTTIRLYRDTTPDGAFSTNNAGSATLVAGTEEYTITDASGAAGSWYRYDFYTGSSASAKSDPFQVLAYQFSDLRAMLAARLGACRIGTCSEDGSVSKLIDATLLDDGVDAKFSEGAWIYLPGATAADKLRRVKNDGFSTADGSFAPTRDWSSAPSSGDSYQIFGLFPPTDPNNSAYGGATNWGSFINQALRYPVVDEVNLGEGTSAGKKVFSLGAHLYLMGKNDLRQVWLRTTDSNSIATDELANAHGRYWRTIINGPNNLSVELNPAPSTSETVIAEVARRYAPLYADTDITEADLELLLRCATWKAYEYLNRIYKGRYEAERNASWLEWQELYESVRPGMVVTW